MDKHFTHLHLHTDYSLLDGAMRIPDLVKFAKEQEWKAVGISDHGNIFGAVKFFQECAKHGVKPVLGCEMYLAPDAKKRDINEKYYHLLLIVQNETGYKNLCKMFAYAYKEGFYFKPRIDYEILKKHSEGLVTTSGCLGGHIPKLLRTGREEEAIDRINWFVDVFGKDRFYLEVQPPEYEKQAKNNEYIFQLAKKMDLNCVATGDAHYLRKDDHEAHEVLLSVGTHNLMSDPNRYTFGEFKGHLKTEKDMLEFFPNNHEAVWNTGKIADSCNFNFKFGELFFPKFEIPNRSGLNRSGLNQSGLNQIESVWTDETYFTHICKKGLEVLKEQGDIPKERFLEYDERLEIEMKLIIKMGFVGYFLIVNDFMVWSKRNKIAVGPGRGSVAGSMVAWALEITNVDPLKYNLLFERFLNPERVSMPDIDIDFCIERREDVINYVKEKYGNDCVCQIITFGTMMAKGVLKDVARTLGFPFKDANTITDLIPDQLKITIDEALEQEPRLKDMIESNPQVKHLFEISKKLEGLIRHASKHAAGVVISPKPLEEVLPLYIPSKTTELVSQYAMTELESLGFLKMDFLGLKNLTLVERALKAIEKNHNVKIDINKLPFDDLKSFELLRDGKTSGVFQFESDGIKDVLYKLQPDKFEDLIAVNALYRPGPLGSGMVDDFIERRHGRKKTTYMFPELEPILSETYGVIVYQEQVMKIASVIAGYSLGGADILRRAMGKKKVKAMEEQKEKFISGAKSNNFDAKKAAELFDLMAYFAGYGFNKSHSTAYALIAYQTAYLKANFPIEFMAALVSFETNNPDKLTAYLQEISDMDIHILPPDVNNSNVEFTAHGDKILFGLQGIKNLGMAAIQNIIAKRAKKPFKDLLDFCYRVDLRCVNKRVIENLIGTGAMDNFHGYRSQKTNELEKIISIALKKKEEDITGQISLFKQTQKEEKEGYTFEPCSEWTDKQKLEKEKELAGFYLSSHPLDSYKPMLKWLNIPSFVETHKNNGNIGFGLLQNFKTIMTKKGSRMAFAQLEDFSGSCEVILFPKIFKKVEELLSEYTVFIVKGNLDTSSKRCKFLADSFIPIEKFNLQKEAKSISIEMPHEFDSKICQFIKESLPKGKTPLTIYFKENGKKLQLRTKLLVKASINSFEDLAKKSIKASCFI